MLKKLNWKKPGGTCKHGIAAADEGNEGPRYTFDVGDTRRLDVEL